MLRTAEYVSPKHPDKICDQIADAILDAILKQDKNARVAVEAMGGHGMLVLMGEVTTYAKVDYENVARRFIPKGFKVLVNITKQSPEIARGVDSGGAGDQGIMVGYATSETKSMYPLEHELAKSLCDYLYEIYPYDGKTQVTIDDGKLKVVVASFQNSKQKQLAVDIFTWIKGKKLKSVDKGVQILANPAGDWKIGGFDSDTGLTGRKIVVDSYGPHIPIGGGSFSGKDMTKVDRSGAIKAREMAVEIIKKEKAREVYVYLAYAIGVKEPVHAEAIIDGHYSYMSTS